MEIFPNQQILKLETHWPSALGVLNLQCSLTSTSIPSRASQSSSKKRTKRQIIKDTKAPSELIPGTGHNFAYFTAYCMGPN